MRSCFLGPSVNGKLCSLCATHNPHIFNSLQLCVIKIHCRQWQLTLNQWVQRMCVNELSACRWRCCWDGAEQVPAWSLAYNCRQGAAADWLHGKGAGSDTAPAMWQCRLRCHQCPQQTPTEACSRSFCTPVSFPCSHLFFILPFMSFLWCSVKNNTLP